MKSSLGFGSLICCLALLAAAKEPDIQQELTATQIIEKNVAARGGLEAWRKIQSMVWVGRVESANAPEPSMPFVMELKRPNKSRFELTALKQRTLRVYDGKNGWKVRPDQGGKPGLHTYTPDELKFAHDAQVIDGPLIDHAAKGISVALEGEDAVEGRKTYRLKVTSPSGVSSHVWIDAESFLDVKHDHMSRTAGGSWVSVPVFYRNYQTIEGLQIPTVIETGQVAVGGKDMAGTDKMVIAKIALNPPLEEKLFARPRVPSAHPGMATVDILPEPPERDFRSRSNLPQKNPGQAPATTSPTQ